MMNAQVGAVLDVIRVLVVEDDYLVAKSLGRVLAGSGAEVVGPVATSEDACALAENERIDVGVLDVVLQNGSSAPIAKFLRSTNRPFVFLTGFHNLDALPEDLRESPCLEKPVDRETLLNAVAEISRSTPRPE